MMPPHTALNAKQLDVRAHQALQLFCLADASMTPLGQSETTVYRVEGADHQRYVLRLHTSGAQDISALNAQALWLDHLSTVAPQFSQRPVRSLTAQWVELLEEHEGVAPLLATLLTWLDGEPLSSPFTLEQATDAGRLIARLHLHAQQADSFAHLECPPYDLAYFRHSWQTLQRTLGDRVQSDQVAVVEAAWPIFENLLDPMIAVPGGYGLIHADAHPGNFVLQGQRLHLIDFGRLGWGAYLLDIAHGMLEMEPAQRAAFLQGYTALRPLPENDGFHLRALMALAALDNLAFLAECPHELEFVLDALPSVMGAIARLNSDTITTRHASGEWS